jgi:hypothetical protein
LGDANNAGFSRYSRRSSGRAILIERFQVIPEGWLSLEETMRQLDRSQRRIQEYVRKGSLKSKRVHLDGRKAPVVIYSAEDAEVLANMHLAARLSNQKVRSSSQRKQRVLPPPKPEPSNAESIAAQIVAAQKAESAAIAELVELLKSRKKSAPASRALFLNIEEASVYAGLSVPFLESEINAKHLFAVPGGPDGAWMISRYAIDSFAGKRRFR